MMRPIGSSRAPLSPANISSVVFDAINNKQLWMCSRGHDLVYRAGITTGKASFWIQGNQRTRTEGKRVQLARGSSRTMKVQRLAKE